MGSKSEEKKKLQEQHKEAIVKADIETVLESADKLSKLDDGKNKPPAKKKPKN